MFFWLEHKQITKYNVDSTLRISIILISLWTAIGRGYFCFDSIREVPFVVGVQTFLGSEDRLKLISEGV